MPPNCIFEVDDILREWTWKEPFDLIHLRLMLGAFTSDETDKLYKQCYESVLLRPRYRFKPSDLVILNHIFYI